MIYLLLNIVFASAFMLIIKWVQDREREDVVTVGAINYISACLLILPGFLQNSPGTFSLTAAMTGGTMGSCYFIAYFFVIYSIRKIGASSSTVIAVLSILLPITCGIFIWNESPNRFQVAGIGLALLSLGLIGGNSAKIPNDITPKKPGPAWITPVVLVVFFLLAGTARLSQETFKHVSTSDQRPTFLFVAFAVAAIPSLCVLAFRRRPVLVREFVLGFALGSANYLQTHFILKSLQYFEGFVVFPITSAGALILTTVIATWLLHERLNRRTIAGIGLASVALVLLHWLPAS